VNRSLTTWKAIANSTSYQVIVIVPPARKVDFLYECDKRNVRVTALMKDLRHQAENDPAAEADLAKVCGFVLNSKNTYGYGRLEQEDKPMLIQEAIASAIQCERFYFYDRLILGVTELAPETFRLLGRARGYIVRPEIAQRYEKYVTFERPYAVWGRLTWSTGSRLHWTLQEL
jgi:hypothetical protein